MPDEQGRIGVNDIAPVTHTVPHFRYVHRYCHYHQVADTIDAMADAGFEYVGSVPPSERTSQYILTFRILPFSDLSVL